MIPPMKTKQEGKKKKERRDNLRLLSMIALKWTTQMVIIWV